MAMDQDKIMETLFDGLDGSPSSPRDDGALLAPSSTELNGEELDISDIKTVKQLYEKLQQVYPPVEPAGTLARALLLLRCCAHTMPFRRHRCDL